MTATTNIFGKGVYSVAEAARFAQLPSRKLKRWVGGYEFKSRGELRISKPLFKSEHEWIGGVVELSFLDLVEVLFVRNFVHHGLPLIVVRKAAERAAELYGVEHPFAARRFKTDGRDIFAEVDLVSSDEVTPAERRRVFNLISGQHSFQPILTPFLKGFDYDLDTDLVNRWWPRGRGSAVVLDPQVQFGAPIIAKYAVPTAAINAAMKWGGKLERVADWYQIPVSAVRDAVEFENAAMA